MAKLNLMIVAVATLVLAACASVPGKYSVPKANADHAVITVENHMTNTTKDEKSQQGWSMPGMESAGGTYKVMLFQVDGNKITAEGGVQKVRVTPGDHTIQVMVDDGLIPLSGDIDGTFAKGHSYDVGVYLDDHGNDRYRADLVDEANPSKVIGQTRF